MSAPGPAATRHARCLWAQRGSFRGADCGLEEQKPLHCLSQTTYFLLSFPSTESSTSSPHAIYHWGLGAVLSCGTHHSGTATSASARPRTGHSPHGGHCRRAVAASRTGSTSCSTGRERKSGSDHPGVAKGRDPAAVLGGEGPKCSLGS